MGYRVRRVDLNQKLIVKTLRSCGAQVLILSEVGNGVPDILVRIQRPNKPTFLHLIEIKNGNLCKSDQKLTMCEAKFHQEWSDVVTVINSVEGAVDFVRQVLIGAL